MPVPPLPLLCDFIAVAAAPKRVEVSDWGFAKLPRELQILIMAMAHRAETIDRRRRWACLLKQVSRNRTRRRLLEDECW